MKTKTFYLFFIVAILSITTSCTTDANEKPTQEPSFIVLNYSYSQDELETMAIINKYRESKGLNSLDRINHVSHKSEEHDHYMIANNVVNHDDFVARSENIIKVLGAVRVSENIAYNYNTSQAAFDAWMNSPNHRENIEGNYTHFGLSIRVNPVNGRKYYTNIFVKM